MSKLLLSHLIDNVENQEAIENVISNVDQNSNVITKIVSDITKKCTGELDDYISYMRDVLHDCGEGKPIANDVLEDITIVLPVLLYDVTEKQESIGIKEDIAKATKNEIFNNTYSSIEKGTVQDKTSQAELAAQEEIVTHIIFQHSYKIIKSKADLGLELLQSVKKVLSKRITELEITRSAK